MMIASVDRPSRPPVPRSSARRSPAGPKDTRPGSSAMPAVTVPTPAEAAVAAEVMAVLAAFGLTD